MINAVLIPKDNEKDLDIIFKTEEKEKREIKKSTSIKKIDSLMLLDNNCYKVDSNKRIFRDTLEIYLINNIFDVLKYALIDNNVSFQNEFYYKKTNKIQILFQYSRLCYICN